MKFDEFKTIWTNISNKILVNLEIEKNHENLENLSKNSLFNFSCFKGINSKGVKSL